MTQNPGHPATFHYAGAIRSGFLNFFQKHGHTLRKSSSLLPDGNDASIMFVNAGMVQFKEIFLGNKIVSYSSATSCQKCLRAGGKHNDLGRVGYTARHHTFFEMLGNFSFGSYGKETAIELAWKFLIEDLGISPNKLCVTHHSSDTETREIWKKLTNFSEEKIIAIDTEDNFWRMGSSGPCGPCTEIFYDHGDNIPGGLPGTPGEDGDRYVEIWNIVFMQFEQLADGSMKQLSRLCVDTGMGLERIAAVCQGVHNNFDSDLFAGLIKRAKHIAPGGDEFAYRVVADHLRAASFLIADGIVPSNEDRGYVLRRIVRRAMLYIKQNIKYEAALLEQLITVLIDTMGAAYPELLQQRNTIETYFQEENRLFAQTLAQGMRYLDLLAGRNKKKIDGREAFKLYDTYGFPLELTVEIAEKKNMAVDQGGFEAAMFEQKQRSRAHSQYQNRILDNSLDALLLQLGLPETNFVGYAGCEESRCNVLAIIDPLNNTAKPDTFLLKEALIALDRTPFYAEAGGQVSDTGALKGKADPSSSFCVKDVQKIGGVFLHRIALEDSFVIRVGDFVGAIVDEERRRLIALNHTAVHLMHAAIRSILGKNVSQKGSLVGPDKLRFDFNYHGKLTKQAIADIERFVNNAIHLAIAIEDHSVSYDMAVSQGAMALFGERYPELVRVVSVVGFSKELCSGTHAKNTSEIGLFKIIAESAVASGIRRIEAVTSLTAFNFLNDRYELIAEIGDFLKISPMAPAENFMALLAKQQDKMTDLDKKFKDIHKEQIFQSLLDAKRPINAYYLIYKKFNYDDNRLLADVLNRAQRDLDGALVFCVNERNSKKSFVITAGNKIANDFFKKRHKRLLDEVLLELGLKGGGTLVAQGSLKDEPDLKSLQDFMSRI